MIESPRVAVVIVSYNSADLMPRCLQALNKQTRKPDLLVVVDNNGSFAQPEMAEQYQYAKKIIAPKSNIGFAAANNLAINELEGVDYVALLNPDAFPEPNWLEILIDSAEKFPGFDSFASRMMMDVATPRVDGAGDIYHFSGLAWRGEHGKPLSEKVLSIKEVFSVCAGASLYRFAALKQVGGFDERFFCYMEDVDLGYRLRLLGKQALYIPEACVTHIGSATTGRGSNFSVYYGHRNLTWTFFKNTPTLLLIFLAPFHLVMAFVFLPIMFFRGQGRVYIKAKYDALAGLPVVWKQRKVLQRGRLASNIDILKQLSFRVFSKY